MAGKGEGTRAEERVIVETYSEELSTLSKSPSMVLVHKFGERQNAYNFKHFTSKRILSLIQK